MSSVGITSPSDLGCACRRRGREETWESSKRRFRAVAREADLLVEELKVSGGGGGDETRGGPTAHLSVLPLKVL